MNNPREFKFFQVKKSKKLIYDFKGGDISSEGGLLLVREFDDKIGFSEGVSKCIRDRRHPDYITYSMADLVRERLYMLMQGYEDCNDAGHLKNDPVFKTILNRMDKEMHLASQPTLSRLEKCIDRRDIKALITSQIDRWLDSFGAAPEEIIIDVDSTDDPTHGNQQMSLFHGYYDQYMYHPLIFSCNGCIIFAYLRPGTNHASRKMLPLLRFLIKKIRARFGNVKIKLRADAGFAIPRIFDYLESEGIEYAIALITNKVLVKKNEALLNKAKELFEEEGEKQRLFQSFGYKPDSWPRIRRVVAKAEVMPEGTNNRFVVTNSQKKSQFIYDHFYVQRGAFENEIKELKDGFSGDRLSCHLFRANFFRLVFSVLAYQLFYYFKSLLQDTEFETMTVQTIRVKLFKVAVRIKESVRRLWFNFCSSFVYQKLFVLLHRKILVLQM